MQWYLPTLWFTAVAQGSVYIYEPILYSALSTQLNHPRLLPQYPVWLLGKNAAADFEAVFSEVTLSVPPWWFCYKIGCQVILVRIDIRILISTRRGANVCGSALGCCGVMRRRSMSVFGVNMKIVVGVYGVRRHHSETTILFVGGKTRRECCSFFFVVVDPDSNRAIKMVVGWHSSRVRTHLFAICIGTLALSHPVFIKGITFAIKIIYSW